MDQAIRLAGEAGTGIVGIRHSSHCGAIGLYGRLAAAAGMIGIAMTNADSMVAPHRGKDAFFGTNPLCIAVPCSDSEPVCMDIATSTTTFNRVINARRDGVDLPPNIGVDHHGKPTTRAEDATALLPFAAHKGYTLAFLIDILCGPLNGMTFGPHLTPMYDDLNARRDLGSLMIAVDPVRFAGGERFADQVARVAEQARIRAAADPARPVLAPGDPECGVPAHSRKDRVRRANG